MSIGQVSNRLEDFVFGLQLEAAISWLDGHLAAAQDESGRVVAIAGPRGSGKARLTAALRMRSTIKKVRWIPDGPAAVPQEYLAEPYGFWRFLLDTRLAEFRPGEILETLREWGDQQPVAIVIGNCQDLDTSSVQLLGAIAKQAPKRVFILALWNLPAQFQHPATIVEQATDASAMRSLQDLVDAGIPALHLGVLGPSALLAVINRRYSLAAGQALRLVEYLIHRSGGFPVDVCSVLSDLEGANPPIVRVGGSELGDLSRVDDEGSSAHQRLRGLIEKLNATERDWILYAALLGRSFQLQIWSGVTGADMGPLLSFVEGAGRDLLDLERNDELLEQVTFCNGWVHQELLAISTLAGPSKQALFHGRIAEWMALLPKPPAATIALHWEASEPGRAAEWWVMAAIDAEESRARLTAAEYYRRGLLLLGSAAGERERFVTLSIAYARMMRYANPSSGLRVMKDAEGAIASFRDDDPCQAAFQAVATINSGFLHLYSGTMQIGLPLLREGVNQLLALGNAEKSVLERHRNVFGPLIDPPAVVGSLQGWLALAGNRAEFDKYAQLYESHPEWRPTAHEAVGRAALTAMEGQVEDSFAAFRQAVERLTVAGTPSSRNFHRALTIGWQLAYAVIPIERVTEYRAPERRTQDRQTAIDRFAEDGVEAWHEAHRHLTPQLEPELGHLPLHFLRGDWDEVLRVAEHAPPAARAMLARVPLAVIARERGHREMARRLIEEMLPNREKTPLWSVDYLVGLAAMRLAAAIAETRDDIDLARDYLALHDDWTEKSGLVLGRAEGHQAWATFYLRQQDLGQARAHAEMAVALARGLPRQQLALIGALRVLGRAVGRQGEHMVAKGYLDESARLARELSATFEEGQTAEAQAQLAEIMQLSTPAAERWERAIECFKRCGAIWRWKNAERHAPEEPMFTPAQRRIFEALTIGGSGRRLRTNREIAGMLGMSESNVKNTISAMAKKVCKQFPSLASRDRDARTPLLAYHTMLEEARAHRADGGDSTDHHTSTPRSRAASRPRRRPAAE